MTLDQGFEDGLLLSGSSVNTQATATNEKTQVVNSTAMPAKTIRVFREHEGIVYPVPVPVPSWLSQYCQERFADTFGCSVTHCAVDQIELQLQEGSDDTLTYPMSQSRWDKLRDSILGNSIDTLAWDRRDQDWGPTTFHIGVIYTDNYCLPIHVPVPTQLSKDSQQAFANTLADQTRSTELAKVWNHQRGDSSTWDTFFIAHSQNSQPYAERERESPAN